MRLHFPPSLFWIALLASAVSGAGVAAEEHPTGNRAERLEWFRDLGFGLFVHWSLDSQLGSVISHSMVAASDDYLKRFVEDLPGTFNPRKFHPEDWAVLARLAGVKYVVFTAKHHSGFCMFDTATTDFNVTKGPFKRDITAEVLEAFREQGIVPGLYFSPDDFWWLHKYGKVLQRNVPAVSPANNPGLLAHDQAQVRELLTKYGPVDIMFFDGPAEGLRELAWQIRPDLVVTRGAIQTPEQYIPGIPLEGPWEANLTMGTQWQYKPTNEVYKSGGDLISTLIETRAKGGNLLLNVGPKPDGELPIEQEERLREIALWMFVNGESIYGVRPWVVTNEGDFWFTRKKNDDTVYVFVKEKERWKYGEWKEIRLRSIRLSEQSRVGVLGQNDRVLEYRSDVIPQTTWIQEKDALHIRAMRAQRLYNDRTWPDPVVLKLTHAKAAMTPPAVATVKAARLGAGNTVVLEGELKDLGSASTVEVGFQYRFLKGLDINERIGAWHSTPLQQMSKPGRFNAEIEGWESEVPYEFRAFVRHPLLTIYGGSKSVSLK